MSINLLLERAKSRIDKERLRNNANKQKSVIEKIEKGWRNRREKGKMILGREQNLKSTS